MKSHLLNLCLLLLLWALPSARVPAADSLPAALPPEVRADLLLKRAGQDLAASRWAAAVKSLAEAQSLGVPLASDFAYQYARALAGAGQTARAQEELARHLKQGRGAAQYEDALRLYMDLEKAGHESADEPADAEDEEFNRAIKAGTSGACRAYLQKYPAGRHAAAIEVRLGKLYYNGEGVPEDEPQAARWFQKAAERGHAEAQALLAFCYAEGRGLSQDDKLAFGWARKAALQGNASGQALLGVFYFTGQGAKTNQSAGEEWLVKAASQGNDAAFDYLTKEKALKDAMVRFIHNASCAFTTLRPADPAQPAGYTKITLSPGLSGFRFTNESAEDKQLVWSFTASSPDTFQSWYLLPGNLAAGSGLESVFKNFKRWETVPDQFPWRKELGPAGDGMFHVSQQSSKALKSGQEYIAWFFSKAGPPAELYVAFKLLPEGQAVDHAGIPGLLFAPRSAAAGAVPVRTPESPPARP